MGTPPRAPLGDRATDDDIYFAYRRILRREPDAGGFAYYQDAVRRGMSLDRLVRTFFDSEEFRFRVDEETRPVAVDLGGYQVLVQKGDADFGQAILDTSGYENHVRDAIRAHLPAGGTLLDVGANIGAITFLGASIVGASGRVIAVEPNPDNLQLLYRGILLNQCPQVRVLPFAASNRAAVIPLSGGRSNSHIRHDAGADTPGHLCQAVRIDELLGDLQRTGARAIVHCLLTARCCRASFTSISSRVPRRLVRT